MPQLEFWPDDDRFAGADKPIGPTIAPAEEAILREFEAEKGAAFCRTPEDRQQFYARRAEQERRAARESRGC